MLHITIICPTPLLKDKDTQSIAQDYIKRMGSMTKINIIDLNVKITNTMNDLMIKDKQGEAIEQALSKLPFGTKIITMDERGKNIKSTQFAQSIEKWQLDGYSHLCFIIGGAYGLSDRLLFQSDFKLSFGAMVWPHRLVGIMLLEQIYRAQLINSGHPYHKD